MKKPINELIQHIEKALTYQPFIESSRLAPQHDNFCSGLVTKVYVVERRLGMIPFELCLISHSSIVCETTRGRAYMVEFCEQFPILVHDVTNIWSFKPKSKWFYGGYKYKRQSKGIILPVVSYSVQYVAKLFQCSADMRGDYVLSGNNCHVVQENVRHTLGLVAQGNLHYGTYVKDLEIEFKPLEELKPYYYM
ncbi:Conserved_hypothetical protein [Hexamita inflata]|uniref:Uncharacterized protein n=1 Tax=Hexamita inflata TaxID=28002 RepID=A0AA86RFG4_9EUKA|nr:Conserved hypothetical protein [Hexamita inflata]CAI9919959.1 Conserved hypothetical protein [Hexamita inflata]CAI9971972.1 Conserved hypothetical protein [Hexamita inflata]